MKGGKEVSKNQQMTKLFVVLFFSTAFIFSFSHFGVQAFGKLANVDGEFSNGTTIGALDVSGKTESEAISLLEEKYVDWLKNMSIHLQYQEKDVPFDMNQFHLDSKQTINSIKDGQNNPAYINIEKSNVQEQLQILFPDLKSSEFNLDKLTTSLTQTASKFENGSSSLNLSNDFLLAEHINKDAVLNFAEIDLKEVPDDLQNILEENPKIEIQAESTFSLLEFVKQKKLKINSFTLNILATGIYQAILPTNFAIVERNIGNVLPSYASLGYEAKVNLDKNVDLAIENPNKGKFILEFQLENELLKVTLKGEKFLYQYKISTKGEQKLTPKTIVQYSPMLLPGKTMIQANGEDGHIIKVYRDVYQGDQFMKSELISEDYYPPVYRVEVNALAGNQQGTTPLSTPDANQTGANTTNTSNQTVDQTTATPDNNQQGKNESDLWGKPNEQPK